VVRLVTARPTSRLLGMPVMVTSGPIGFQGALPFAENWAENTLPLRISRSQPVPVAEPMNVRAVVPPAVDRLWKR
jgi:hypothetical protein